MANNGNLRPIELTHEEAVRNGRKGGIASGEARREKRLMRDALNELLSREYTGSDGELLDGTTALMLKVFRQAMKGDMRAMEFIRATTGQDPVQRVESIEIPSEAYERVAKALDSNEDE